MILVTGATGTVGGRVIRRLLETGTAKVRALTRDPDGANLPGTVEVIRGDLADPASLAAAVQGVERVFLVWPNLAADHAASETLREIAQHAQQIVYFSSAEAGADDPINTSHGEIERLIRESGVKWTFLRITGLATNDLAWAPGIRGDGVVRDTFAGLRRSLIHEADIADVAVRVLTEDGHAGATHVLTGPEALTPAERVGIIGEVTGRRLRFEELPAAEALRQLEAVLPAEVAAELIEKDPEPEPVTGVVYELTGHPARTYREWVVDHVTDLSGGSV